MCRAGQPEGVGEDDIEIQSKVIILTEPVERTTGRCCDTVREEEASSRPKNSIDSEIANFKAKYRELEIRPKRRATPKQRVIIWITGAVIAALLPLAAIGVSEAASHRPAGFYEMTARETCSSYQPFS